MTTLTPYTVSHGLWIDCASTNHPPAWYQGLFTRGIAGVILDCMSTGWESDWDRALTAGLGVQLFQGFWAEQWADPQEATHRAELMVAAARLVHLPPQVVCWLDCEAVPGTVSADAFAEWVTTWSTIVARNGWRPGYYIGANQPLDSQALYTRLPGQHYWRGCSQDIPPVAVRGYQVHQTQCSVTVDGVTVDVDIIGPDALGGVPVAVRRVAPPASPPDPTVAQHLADLTAQVTQLRTQLTQLQQEAVRAPTLADWLAAGLQRWQGRAS